VFFSQSHQRHSWPVLTHCRILIIFWKISEIRYLPEEKQIFQKSSGVGMGWGLSEFRKISDIRILPEEIKIFQKISDFRNLPEGYQIIQKISDVKRAICWTDSNSNSAGTGWPGVRILEDFCCHGSYHQ